MGTIDSRGKCLRSLILSGSILRLCQKILLLEVPYIHIFNMNDRHMAVFNGVNGGVMALMW